MPNRHQHFTQHGGLGQECEQLTMDPLQCRPIECLGCAHNGRAPIVKGRMLLHRRLRLGCEQITDLADGQAVCCPAQDIAYALYIPRRVKSVATLGALRTYQPMAPLPGTQGHRIDAGQADNIAHR
ncbi:hypothetical protein D3C80_1532570 [compost metagenome]